MMLSCTLKPKQLEKIDLYSAFLNNQYKLAKNLTWLSVQWKCFFYPICIHAWGITIGIVGLHRQYDL